MDDDHKEADSNSDEDLSSSSRIRTDRRVLAQNKLRETECEAKRVLVAMRESIKVQRVKTLRDAKEYQRNLLKLKAMNQQRQEMEYQHENERDNRWQNESKIIGGNRTGNKRRSVLDHDHITSLKMDMIHGLQQEVENLTQIWEDELNTIAELIRFQIPLQRTNANLHRLCQQIVAREMLFKRRIRLVSELRTQNKINLSHLEMMDGQGMNSGVGMKENVKDIKPQATSDTVKSTSPTSAAKSFFSALVGKNEVVEALP